MNTAEAITILKKHNEWRRDNSVNKNMQNPKEIGEAIDHAVNFMIKSEIKKTSKSNLSS